ncbi:LamG-like jellyroll fold domain-containing protein [Planctomycetota bacterium]
MRVKTLLTISAMLAFLGLCGVTSAGSSLEFDGVDDFVDLGDSSSLKPDLPLTLSAWIKLDSSGSRQYVISLDDQSSNYYGVWMQVQPDGNVNISYGDGGDRELVHRRTKNGTTILSTNDWHHVAAVVRGPVDMDIYINGQNDGGTYSGTGGGLQYSFSGNSNIGTRLDLLNAFDGIIDEVGLYDRALTEQEIEQIIYSGVFADPNLLGYWAFEEGEGQVASDSSGNDNDGQLGSTPDADDNDPVWVQEGAPEGLTYHVDGVDGDNGNNGLTKETAFATIQKGVNTAQDGDTVLVWPGVYNESVNIVNKAITVKSAADAAAIDGGDNDAVSLYGFEDKDSTLKNFVIRNGYAGVYVDSGSPVLSNLTVVDNYTGIEAEDGAEPNISSCIFWNNDDDLWNCTAQYSFVQDEIEDGLVAHWKFDEGEGDTAYDSIDNHDGTLIGNPQWSAGKVGSHCLEFDGNGDKVNVAGDVEMGTDFTMCAWVNRDTIESGSRVMLLKGDIGDSLATNNKGMYLASDGDFRMMYEYGSGGTNYVLDSGFDLAVGEWYFLAVVRDDSDDSVSMYVDGSLVFEELSTPAPSVNSASFRIGEWATGEGQFDGKIDNARVYNRSLSDEEIEQLYKQSLAGFSYIDPGFADANDGDYHLLSERGRYWPEHDVWVLDDVTSPGIDGGDPNVNPMNERMPNGGRINMGAYGNTAYASMSEWALLADFNFDGIVDFIDYAAFADSWLEKEEWKNE